MINEESRLNLAHQNLRNIPKTLVHSYQDSVKIIDLSNNNITDVSFLSSFIHLTCIILDHNDLSSDAIFPPLPEVKILWANHNQINIVSRFVSNLANSFPKLQQLSLMGNPGTPLCHEETYYHYLRYRLFVISCFPLLEYLDDRPVTDYEREEAKRHFRSYPLMDRFSYITDVFSDAVNKLRQYISPSFNDRPNSNIII